MLNPTQSLGRSTSHESQLAPRTGAGGEGTEVLNSPSHSVADSGVGRSRMHSESEAESVSEATPFAPTGYHGRRGDALRDVRTAHNSPVPSALASPSKSPKEDPDLIKGRC